MSALLEQRADAAVAQEGGTVPGVRRLDSGTARLQRRLVLIVTIVPFVGFIAAAWRAWGHGLSPLDLSIFATMYLVTGFGITVGFHRLFTHQSFRARRWLSHALAIAGSMAIQGPVIRWVADHRRHHAFSDQAGDPHSPHLDDGPGMRAVLKALRHAHIGSFVDDQQTSARRWAPDLVKDPAMRRIDSLFPLWVGISFGLPPIVGFTITGTLSGAMSAFLWGSLARIFLLHHVTWSINSICHFYGSRPYRTSDFSTNNWVLSLISLGESWQNYHHAFPTSAVHGLRRRQIDLTAGVIRLLSAVGLAWDVKQVSDKQLTAKTTA